MIQTKKRPPGHSPTAEPENRNHRKIKRSFEGHSNMPPYIYYKKRAVYKGHALGPTGLV